MQQQQQPTQHNWRALRAISVALRIFAWIVLVVGVQVLVTGILGGILHSGGVLGGSVFLHRPGLYGLRDIALVVRFIILFGLGFLALYGAGELISLLIAIEENTRSRGAGSAYAPPTAPSYVPPPGRMAIMPPPTYIPPQTLPSSPPEPPIPGTTPPPYPQ